MGCRKLISLSFKLIIIIIDFISRGRPDALLPEAEGYGLPLVKIIAVS